MKCLNDCQDVSIKARPSGSDFSADLLDIFEKLNFRNPSEQQYINPKKIFGNEKETFWTLDSLLAQWLMRVTDSYAYIGTPKKGTKALEDFYETIRNAIYFTGKKLKELPWEEAYLLAETWILKIFEASKLCGGRLYNTAVTQYVTVMTGNQESYETYLANVSGKLRLLALDTAVSYLINNWNIIDENDELILEHTIHFSNQLMRAFGAKYKIPGYQALSAFEDEFRYLSAKKVKIAEKIFLSTYSNPEAFFHWIRDDIWHDDTIRSLFITYLKNHIPESFENNKYNSIMDEIGKWNQGNVILTTPYDRLTGEQKLNINALFSKKENDIFIARTQTPTEAIHEDRATQYIESIYETIQQGNQVVSRVKSIVILELLAGIS